LTRLQRKKPAGKKKPPSSASASARAGKARSKVTGPRRAASRSKEVPGSASAAAGSAGGPAVADRVKEVARARRLQESRAVAEVAIEAALDKKALLPVLLDVSERATYTDFIGIVSGRSDRQVEAIAEHVATTLKARGWQLLSREGNGGGRWTLLDFGDIVVHVFYHPVREFYDIESLWIDAPRVKLKVPPEATQLREEALFYERP
jgi:ribosome-associated protein